jgi:cytochrome P450
MTEEVRSAFKNEDEITLISTGQLTYMMACLDEALRMYPPVANGLPRVSPKGGSTIMGIYIPEQVILNTSPCLFVPCLITL